MRSERRTLTTHVGSLVRPPELIDLLSRRLDGEPVAADVFEAMLDRTVAEVVRQQAEVGIDIVSDGEFPKTSSWSRYVFGRLGGLTQKAGVPVPVRLLGGKDRRDFADFYNDYEAALGPGGIGKQHRMSGGASVVEGPIRYVGHDAVQRDIARLKAATDGAGVAGAFLPVVAPVSAAATLVDEHYRNEEALLFAIAEALNEEYRAIADAGLLVQIDDAFLASAYDALVPPKSLEEYRTWANLGVEALNHALRGVPADRVRYHVCWGSWNGPHTNDVNARDIADLILKVNAGGYSLEMANPRHEHEWRVWETVKLPEGKVLLPGVISHCTNVVEHPELVAERVVRLARLVGRENVIASTDCGFAQGAFGRRVHPSIMWAKLASLAAGAAIASTELWGNRAAA